MSKAKLFQHPHYRAFKAIVEKKDKKAWPEISRQLVIAYEAGSVCLNNKTPRNPGCISTWFFWEATPQGHHYWWELDRTYSEL